MIRKQNDKNRKRMKRKIHIRKRIHGTAERPRMSVFRSNKNISVQVIDDDKGCTLVSVSTLEKDLASLKVNIASGEKVGEEIGKRLKEKNIDTVVFDRNGFLYHGVVAAVADGARKAGINF
ncbi:50S ribosomal protein L18 [Treponema phagedenis]|uniref:Large ribosomal subunit protein uL18 n=1 Tax=Treponema phagedenis TaxID=162 RepID=A0A0B7H2R4_TREPH|nr:50S ribosomal protein L18 [Treponema phagedenis]EFW36688.1 ribosomal protein L18 [Treponema phagedenis F0421]NVP24165.1 50S ribosomal protein L18 [Treponema phagedenis]QEJ96319.1 50S ribosomal protein L18 [Treponema phagedenis]QEJ99273.1 50S ribosomal protein L18 [Treponema phagedenis]QEK00096.1 50S ribosomal protein L18 [Treponema phagedenis]